MKNLFWWGLLFFCCACAVYHPAPLTETRVNQALKLPPKRVLSLKASLIKHPLLKPVKIDFNQGLTPQGIAVLAVILNPQLRRQRDRLGIAYAQLIEAGLLPNPEFSLDMEFPTGGETQNVVNGYNAGISFGLRRLLTRHLYRKAEGLRYKAIQLDIAWKEWQVAEAAKCLAYRLIFLRRQLGLLIGHLKVYKKFLSGLKNGLEGGFVTYNQYLAEINQFNDLIKRQEDLKKKISETELRLKALIGLPPDFRLKLVCHPENLKPDVKQVITSKYHLENRLDLVGLKRLYEAHEALLKATIEGQFPSVSLNFDQARDVENVYAVIPGISVSLPIFNRNQAQIALKKAERKAVFDEYLNRLYKAQMDIKRLTANIAWIARAIETEQAILAKLKPVHNAVLKGLSTGRCNEMELISIKGQIFREKMRVLSLKAALMENLVGLELESGHPLGNI